MDGVLLVLSIVSLCLGGKMGIALACCSLVVSGCGMILIFCNANTPEKLNRIITPIVSFTLAILVLCKIPVLTALCISNILMIPESIVIAILKKKKEKKGE